MDTKNLLVSLLCINFTTFYLLRANAEVHVELYTDEQVKPLNDRIELVCTVSGCAQEAKFMWSTLGDITVGGSVLHYNSTTSRLQINHLTKEDNKVIICRISCGTEKKERTKKIITYSFPSPPVVWSNDSAVLICTVHKAYPSNGFQIDWWIGNVISQSENTVDTFYSGDMEDIHSVYRPTSDNLGKNITCTATLKMKEKPDFMKVQTVTVQYGPAFLTVSNDTVVKIGERLELRCDSDEKSAVTWRKLKTDEAIQKKVLVIERTTWRDGGTYECEARTALGSRRSRVTVIVQVHPRNSTVLVHPSTQVKESQNITILCSTVSVPPASITLMRERDGYVFTSLDGIFHLPSLRSEDQGVYLVNFTNDLGYEVQTFELFVAKEPVSITPKLVKTVVPAVGSMSLLVPAGLLIRYLRRLRKSTGGVDVGAALNM